MDSKIPRVPVNRDRLAELFKIVYELRAEIAELKNPTTTTEGGDDTTGSNDDTNGEPVEP